MSEQKQGPDPLCKRCDGTGEVGGDYGLTPHHCDCRASPKILSEQNVQVTRAMAREIPALNEAQLARLWAKVNKDGPNGCWLWTGSQSGNATHKYGDFTIGRRHFRPHRLIYALSNGGLRTDQAIDHLCRTTLCVNPAHLEAVSPAENTLRGNSYPTHCRNGHELSGRNVAARGSGLQRVCRRCSADRTARYKARRRANG